MSAPPRPALVVALAASLMAAAASAQQEGFSLRRATDQEFDQRVRRADPGKVVAAEIAFARAAQEKGQWTAFTEFAANDAVMFVPEPVKAKDWLKKQRNPAQAVRWQPHQIWSSCDGTLAVTKGAWQRADGSTGYFTTVWERQRKGEYKWVMDQGDTLEQPLEAPDMIGSSVAHCSRPTVAASAAPSGDLRQGLSRDGTLRWMVLVQPDGRREIEIGYWDGSEWREAIRERVAAE